MNQEIPQQPTFADLTNGRLVAGSFEKQSDPRQLITGPSRIALVGAGVELIQDAAEQQVAMGYTELAKLSSLGVPMLDTSIGYGQSISDRKNVITTATPYLHNFIELEAALQSSPETVDKISLIKAVRGLTDYVDESVGSDKPFLYDVFGLHQFVVLQDGSVALADTEPLLCEPQSGARQQYQADALVQIQDMLLKSHVDKSELDAFVLRRNEILKKIEQSSSHVYRNMTTFTIKRMDNLIAGNTDFDDSLGELTRHYANLSEEELDALDEEIDP